MILWISGLAGAGKTTLAKEVVRLYRLENQNVIHLDGDRIREIMHNFDYSLAGRGSNARTIAKLCCELSNQGIHVVCSILSIFEEHKRYCVENSDGFAEVFIEVSMKNLRARDQKALYSGAENKQVTNVIGVDIPFNTPATAAMTIENNVSEDEFLASATRVLRLLP